LTVIVVGLSHHTAPIDVRERLAMQGDALDGAIDRLRAAAEEVVLLSTCNRVEVYAARAGELDAVARDVTTVLAELGGREVVPHLSSHHGADAVKHLFRVASSLDSLVIGEPQILGQLKDAIRAAQQRKLIGRQLNPVMRHAMVVAKRVRSETEVGSGQVSVPTVAVELAQRIFDELSGHVVLLVGAGEMAETAAKLLARHGTRLVVVNRSPGKAAELATAVGGEARRWDDLAACLGEADVVVTSTASPDPVITVPLVKSIAKKRRGRSLFLIDIAVPRDVDPRVNELDNVFLYDIDDLSRVVAETLAGRAAEAERAEGIVADEAKSFAQRRTRETVTPVIVGLREKARQVLAAELDKTLRGRLKHLAEDEAVKKALEGMLAAQVNKLLHEPTTRLKELAMRDQGDEAAQLLSELFDLEEAVAAAGDSEEAPIALDEELAPAPVEASETRRRVAT
jgi:glutamyl-tRNA reductase